jgi:hypothetical protein
VYRLARAVQFLGLVVGGSAFFVGLIGHNIRRELLLAGIGAGIFFAGYALQKGSR